MNGFLSHCAAGLTNKPCLPGPNPGSRKTLLRALHTQRKTESLRRPLDIFLGLFIGRLFCAHSNRFAKHFYEQLHLKICFWALLFLLPLLLISRLPMTFSVKAERVEMQAVLFLTTGASNTWSSSMLASLSKQISSSDCCNMQHNSHFTSDWEK